MTVLYVLAGLALVAVILFRALMTHSGREMQRRIDRELDDWIEREMPKDGDGE